MINLQFFNVLVSAVVVVSLEIIPASTLLKNFTRTSDTIKTPLRKQLIFSTSKYRFKYIFNLIIEI